MLIVCVLVFIALDVLASVSVPHGGLGSFERKRRQRQGISDDLAVERELLFDEMISLQRSLQALLLTILTICLTAAYGWVNALLFMLVVIVGYGFVSRQAALRTVSMKLYAMIERPLLGFVSKHKSWIAVLRAWPIVDEEHRVHSRDELVHLVQQSELVLSSEEKTRLVAGLEFSDRVIKAVMTPRSMIETVSRSELLGPLVLDELHKKGFSRFPVIDGDLDHVAGVLHLRDVLTLDTSKKHTSRVETAMRSTVYYIHEDQTLAHALAAFVRTHHHLFIVVNEFRETVGLLTLEDVIEALIGYKIVDEYEAHDDLRAVAKRSPRANKLDATHHDI